METVTAPGKSGPAARLRSLPGFRAAAVAFCTVVLLGAGAVFAVAAWQQSAAVTMTVTAAPPSSTLPPGITPVVAAPVLAARPGAIPNTPFSCATVQENNELQQSRTADVIFSWAKPANTTGYQVTLASEDTGYSYSRSKTVTTESAVFTLEHKPSSDGNGVPTPFYVNYVLRVVPMNGAVAGEPFYKTYQYRHKEYTNCFYHAPSGASPAGTPTSLACAAVPGLAVLQQTGSSYADIVCTWNNAVSAPAYMVTLASKSGSPVYGAEVTVTGRQVTFRIPRTASDANGNPLNGGNASAAYYADYALRIQPMNGITAGDPASGVLRYKHWSIGYGDN